ncbi:MAG: hypothetical protein D6710_08950 [Nitrospirae bacterium]|nr:MAG: hypothetical protein D6710_08950 [Nitrospirota bacterium]
MRFREDKSTLYEPRCPFCREFFSRPDEIETELGFFSGGVCNCGAVYAFDPTGRNLGETFMDALSYACGGDYERALSLESGVDYDEVLVQYNYRTHSLSPRAVGGPFVRGGAKGVLYFIRLKNIKGSD